MSLAWLPIGLCVVSCGARSQEVEPPPAVPGPVGSILFEPGEAKAVRTYGDRGDRTWGDLRASVGHASHLGREDVLCRDCHQKGFEEKGSGSCARAGCHQTQALHTHGALDATTASSESGCTTCHSFEPGKATPTCMGCHDKAQTKRETRKDALVAPITPGAPLATLAPITDGHAKAECGSCHDPHKAPLSHEAACDGCHKQKATAHAAHEGSKGCSDCHATHTLAKAASTTCATCHKTVPGMGGGPKPAGHASCLTCHVPHAEKKGAKACEGCHKERALAAEKVASHAVCTSCHVAHDPKAATDAACAKCHGKVKLAHAKPGNAKGTPKALAAYAGKGASSVNGCEACHAAHPGGKTGVASCTSCHGAIATADVGAHAAKLGCTSCHAKHDFAAPSKATVSALCSGCHEAQSKLVADTKGHASCVSCHTSSTHKETKAATCASCHAAEQASAPKGHQTCESCHAKHSGKVTSDAACSTCHAKVQKALHGALKGGCETCHRAHGRADGKGVAAPPTCTTCHATTSLGGLHVKSGHQDCSKCHSSHAAPNATHDNCTHSGCHADRKTHQSEAKSCIACHFFDTKHKGAK